MLISNAFQDFTDAIAIYPDLSNVRWGVHLTLFLFTYKIPPTKTTFHSSDSYQLCRLKDLELLLQNAVAAN